MIKNICKFKIIVIIQILSNCCYLIRAYFQVSSCSSAPKQLLGYFKPDLSPISTDELVQKDFGLDEHGCYRPSSCVLEENVLIIIPYRDRLEHLNILLNNLHPFLQRQKLAYCVLVVEQYDKGKFNKGLLMNAAFVEGMKFNVSFDCIVFHDVDMLPECDYNFYTCHNSPTPRHLSPKIDKYNYEYPYGTNFGGVTIMTKQEYQSVNGYTNLFWGRGKEDADMEYRISASGFDIKLPENIDFGRYVMLRHGHISTFQSESITVGLDDDRSTSLKKTLMGIKEQRLRFDGLNSLFYGVKSILKKRIYTHLFIDVRRTETIQQELLIGQDFDSQQGHQIKITPNLPITCKFIEYKNALVDTEFSLKDYRNINAIVSSACSTGCAGFRRYSEGQKKVHRYQNNIVFVHQKKREAETKHYDFSLPILRKMPEGSQGDSTIYLKHCENDASSWQIVPNVIKVVDKRPTSESNFCSINTVTILNFKKLPHIPTLGQLYYRDSWIYEGQRYKTNNFKIQMDQVLTPIDHENEIIHEHNEYDNSTRIIISLNTLVANGHYSVFSKIVDNFGQPLGELNWFMKLDGCGNIDPEYFREKFTVPAEKIRRNFDRKIYLSDSGEFIDKIMMYKIEMKKDFKYFWST